MHSFGPRFGPAVAAIDAGDVAALERILDADPDLVRDRAQWDEHAYFRDPYLLWFVAENPVRNDRLPPNIADVARAIIAKGASREQLDYALELVCSGRVPREHGVQNALIDVLCDAGADPDAAMTTALAHGELDAAQRLLERGARMSLLAAICFDRAGDAERLVSSATTDELQLALVAAALYGNARMLSMLIERGADINACAPAGFHAHATPLHHAVDSGSLDAVKVLAEAGANRDTRDRVYHATPLEWAEYLEKPQIASYLRA
ncbi:MAG TPA: ankyrin repeat domain-containing protein [Thermoanaerobaculia bacterium]|nr:ankyrin repeat domain-containing protein [Thermoanaerobaculia bacterium]